MNVSFPKCNQAGTEFVISTTDDLQEKVNYLSEDFPVAIFTQTYHHAASDSTPFHWHNELQLNWVSEGELEYCINGDSLRLSGDKILLVRTISFTVPTPPEKIPVPCVSTFLLTFSIP